MALWCRSYEVGREGQDRFRLSAKKCSRIPHVLYCPTRPVDSSAAVVILFCKSYRHGLVVDIGVQVETSWYQFPTTAFDLLSCLVMADHLLCVSAIPTEVRNRLSDKFRCTWTLRLEDSEECKFGDGTDPALLFPLQPQFDAESESVIRIKIRSFRSSYLLFMKLFIKLLLCKFIHSKTKNIYLSYFICLNIIKCLPLEKDFCEYNISCQQHYLILKINKLTVFIPGLTIVAVKYICNRTLTNMHKHNFHLLKTKNSWFNDSFKPRSIFYIILNLID
uniref:Uncharacterized protein n=1 Tax=Heterorhabditis bacteriophora TaxID=37862 RepID=A0A1I7X4K7_HETBA